MNTGMIKRITGFVLVMTIALTVGACTRSASTPPPDTGASNGTSGEMTGQQATMEAVRSALLTQTAQAQAPVEEPTATAEPTEMPATDTPEASPTDDAEPTADGTAADATDEPAAATDPSGSTEYTVLQGEWVYSIANKFGVDPQAIIDLNDLEAPYSLTVGQVLLIPSDSSPAATTAPATDSPTQSATSSASGTEYTVLEGEWVYSIARKFGVDPQDIIDTNNLEAPYTLHPGDVLIIP